MIPLFNSNLYMDVTYTYLLNDCFLWERHILLFKRKLGEVWVPYPVCAFYSKNDSFLHFLSCTSICTSKIFLE